MSIDLKAIEAHVNEIKGKRLFIGTVEAQAIADREVLLAEVKRQDEEISSVTAERDAAIARADKAEDDIEILAINLDPCEICERKRHCVHPASCPKRNHSSFRYCGTGKEQNDGKTD